MIDPGHDEGPTSKTLRIWPHSAGFFSNFNKVVSALSHKLGRDGIEAIVVDWALPVPIAQFPYGAAADGNVWERLFEPLAFDHFPAAEQVFEAWDWSNSMPSGPQAYYMYKTRGWRERYHAIFSRYIRVRPHLIDRAEALLGTPGPFRIGVHYRHPGHNYECPAPIAPAAVFIDRARKLASGPRDWQVVLATDVESTLAEFRAAFGDRLIHQSGIARSTDNTQVHEAASTGDLGAAEAVLVDALMLSRCDAMLHITSNIATAVGFMNPKLDMHYVETPLEALSASWQRVRPALAAGPLGGPVRFAKRTARAGRKIVRAATRPRPKLDGKIFFFHLPKTAGSSLWAVLGGLADKSNIFQVWSAERARDFTALSPSERGALQIVGGHFPLGFYSEKLPLDSYFCVTTFRDPVRRAQSEYFYALRTPNHSEHAIISRLSFRDFVERSPNPVTRLLSGTDDPRAAFEIVQRVFDRWVFIDDIDVLAAELRQRARLPAMAAPRVNVGPHAGQLPPLDADALRAIEQHHAADIELHRLLVDSYAGEAVSGAHGQTSDEPVFHIVTPMFNAATYLDETIQSVVTQAGNFSIRYHIQDGGSTDGSMAIVRRWQARLNGGQAGLACRRVTLTASSQVDEGMYDALRLGFDRLAPPQDAIMSWINADDRLAPGALANVAGALRDLPGIDLVGGRPATLDVQGRAQINRSLNIYPRRFLAAGLHDGRHLPCVMQEGTFWRAALWHRIGGIDRRYRLAGDWDLWRRFAAETDYVTLDDVLAFHRRRPGQLSEDMVSYHSEVDTLGPGPDAMRVPGQIDEDSLAIDSAEGADPLHGVAARRDRRGKWTLVNLPAPKRQFHRLEHDGDWIVGTGFGPRESAPAADGRLVPFFWTTSSRATLLLHSARSGRRRIAVEMRCKGLFQRAQISVGGHKVSGRPVLGSKELVLEIEHDCPAGVYEIEIGVDRLRPSRDGRMLGVMVRGVRFIDAE